MPTDYTAPTGAPCWIDLMTSDPARSKAFYTELFGWEAEAPNPEFGGYTNFTRDGVRVAGCMASQPGEGPADVWSGYLAVDDAAKTLEVAAARGGQVVVPAMAVGDLGSMGFLTDVGGASVGVWQPGAHRGFGTYGEPGAPGWFELHTRDYHATLDFYREVFGWQTRTMGDTDEFRYSVVVDGELQVAGVMDGSGFLPEGVPAHWSVYFSVEDTDATLARAVELGGAVAAAAEDTPYGRLATATDATGATFKLVGRNAATEEPA